MRSEDLDGCRIGIIGLGYVGLPLAISFAGRNLTCGYDISEKRIRQLNDGVDVTNEVSATTLQETKNLRFTSNIEDLSDCNVFIITVPTPITEAKAPDFGFLIAASGSVGRIMPEGAVVIYESTVYPGATREVCVPELARSSNMTPNVDFFYGYSPERINPGDKENSISNIVKLTSGSSPEVANFIDSLYSRIIDAGTHKCDSIEVAEAAKVIENTQRDINIAFMNELSVLFSKLNLPTREVLAAASTKWNFLRFSPGLVGGHCISVDPYYLAHKSQAVGFSSELVSLARKINDSMVSFVVQNLTKAMIARRKDIADPRVIVLGLTFKENCPDLRNSKALEIVDELIALELDVTVFDPLVRDDVGSALSNGVTVLRELPESDEYNVVIVTVAHSYFQDLGDLRKQSFVTSDAIIFDIKNALNETESDLTL